MCKEGHMDKAKGGRFRVGGRDMQGGGCGGGKMKITVLEQKYYLKK